MPGMLVSIVCVTLMSPFAISSPHSAIVQALVVPAVGVFERELAGRERTNATGDQHRPARILILIGEDGEERLAVLLAAPEADDLFAEMDRRLPLQALFREGLHQVL